MKETLRDESGSELQSPGCSVIIRSRKYRVRSYDYCNPQTSVNQPLPRAQNASSHTSLLCQHSASHVLTAPYVLDILGTEILKVQQKATLLASESNNRKPKLQPDAKVN